ncbi:MAG TPA: TonB-dependent receptor [Candidatus Baltobacteraceae bacterium]
MSAATVPSNASTIVAQAVSTGTVSGSFTDSSGSPVAGAAVKISGPATYTTTTDAKGAFSISDVKPGIYMVLAQKAGYANAEIDDLAVVAGTNSIVNATMAQATFSSIREIARVSARRGTVFNASSASSAVVSAQVFQDQAQPQVQRVLDQTPGIVIDHPGTSANNASPGAITFPTIRGGLGFETASFIDGHPLSVGTFGDYVTSFLNTYTLGSTEVVKGPGAIPPELAYAIGGTVNFRTKDPTRTPTGSIAFGAQSTGGLFTNYGWSGTTPNGKFGWVLDYGVNDFEGPLTNSAALWNLPSSSIVNGSPLGFVTNAAKTNYANNPFEYSGTSVACCFRVSHVFVNKTELVKFKFGFSPSTALTVSYLGSQTWTDQNGNHNYGYNQLFAPCGIDTSGATPTNAAKPCAAYTGSNYLTGQHLFTWQNIFPPQGEWEVNNEPIFQGELRSTLGHDTLLARYYTASINRLQYSATTSPGQTITMASNIWGCRSSCNNPNNTFTGGIYNVVIPGTYFLSTEEDKLHGYTFQIDHPFGDSGNFLTASFDSSASSTRSYSYSGTSGVRSWSVPDGARQRYNTLLLKGTWQLTPKLKLVLGNYFENFYQRYSVDYVRQYAAKKDPTFVDSNINRDDVRLAMEYRANGNISYRFGYGSTIAPPYAALLNATTNIPAPLPGQTFVKGSTNNPDLKPETAIGFDLGSDVRFGRDGEMNFSWDVYRTELRNQFLTTTQFVCPNFQYDATSPNQGACLAAPTPTTVQLFASSPNNIGKARYEGIEMSLRDRPTVGLGYTVQGALLRAYPYDLGPCFYAGNVTLPGGGAPPALDCTKPTANLGIINGQNFQGSGPGGGGFFGISNHAIPYAQAYGEINWHAANGMYAAFGEQLYGHNNSLSVPAFWVANANLRLPLSKQPGRLSVQFSVDNVFNAYGNAYIDELGGVHADLVPNAQTSGGVPLYAGQTNANTIGPRTFRLVFTANLGAQPQP